MEYRKEIDGLRALAVLPVILHHAGLPWLPGGFLGVDVFFVISGYLITGLILEQLRQGRFSLRYFYDRRARRILPALFFVMAVCIPFGWWLMLPDDLENFGQSLVATVFMGNNFLLWLTSGYWAMEALFKPLMHTWSLGVEEQYYLLVPVLLLGIWWLAGLVGGRAGRANRSSPLNPLLRGVFLLIFLVSLVYAQQLARVAPELNFLMLGSRAWELAAGGLLAVWASDGAETRESRLAAWAGGLGLLLIIAPMALFDVHTPHPAVPTLLPVLGTALVIRYAGRHNWPGRLLSLPGVVLVGLISYSAYLWHQPLFAFVRIASLEEPGWPLMLGLGAVALVLAYGSWRFVEQPFRVPGRVANRVFVPLIVIVGLGIAAVGYHWHQTSGQLHRWPALSDGEQYGARLNATFNTSAFRFEGRQFAGDAGKPNLLVIGRSFARDFINAGVEAGYFGGHDLVYLPRHDPCGLVPADNPRLFADSDVIVFASGFSKQDAECLLDVKGEIRALTDARLVVVGTKNFGWNINAVMRLAEPQRYRYRAKVMESVRQMNDEAKAVLPDSMYVDVIDMLADDDGRVAVFTPARTLISQDRKHLTRPGAEYVGRVIFEHPLLRELK